MPLRGCGISLSAAPPPPQLELFKYFNSVTSNRGFILKVFAVLLFIIVLVSVMNR